MKVPIEIHLDTKSRVTLEDIDKDGDADVVFYVGGVRVYSIQASTLADNVRSEFKRVVKRIRKAVKK